jgi:hypothetical protein
VTNYLQDLLDTTPAGATDLTANSAADEKAVIFLFYANKYLKMLIPSNFL